MRIPISIITGYLGSGKTTLLRKILSESSKKIAVIMNEFGEIGIDGEIIKGKNVDMVELSGGCVCCSLTGEFEAAVKEVIEKINPDQIVIETTGVAEPDAIIVDIEENIEGVRLDSIITIADADSMIKYPSIGYTGRVQLEMADIILVNKTDLVTEKHLEEVEEKIEELNPKAVKIRTIKCNADIDLLFGLYSEKFIDMHPHSHIEEDKIQFFAIETGKLDREKFLSAIENLPKEVYRLKGFV
ncbi:MAG: CobW family GTP-binding protein, partial [Candidatus Aenigmarchaeota archaeon]|nr:CobW family GTP-binding protein [Candidatus Aenigmarchaeota archaeon]MDI6721960.1 CobW family GTP-binding protein [Candidatus Aenigmarchaeota archaeon]